MSNSRNGNEPYQIAIVGPSQAGKTMLAAGLCAAFSDEYSVEIVGGEGRDYLTDRMKELAAGQRFYATDGEPTSIRLKINRGKKDPVEVDFKDYKGENVSKTDTIKKIIGDPQGVMILMNPQMKTRDEQGNVVDMGPDKCVEIQERIKGIVDFLSEDGKACNHVAVVVTASDLLGTDLESKGFADYKNRIIACLKANPKFCGKCKGFHVTVTGKLEDQNHPRIAPGDENTSRKPFEWLIEQIEKDASVKTRKSFWLKCLCGFFTLLGLGLVAWPLHYFWIDRMKESAIADAIAAHDVVKDSQDLGELGKHVRDLKTAVRKASESATQDIYFVKNQRRYLERRKELVELKDEAVLAQTGQKIKAKEAGVKKKPVDAADFAWLKGEIESIGEFGNELAGVETSSLSNRLEEVKQEFEGARTRMLAQIGEYFCENLQTQIAKEVESVEEALKKGGIRIDVGSHRKFWKSVFENYDCGSSNVLAKKTKEDWKKIVDGAIPVCSNLCVKIDQHNADVICANIATEKASIESDLEDGNAKKINDALVGVKNYVPLAQTNDFPRLRFEQQNAKERLAEEKNALLDELRKCLVARVKEKHAQALSDEENEFLAKALRSAQALSFDEYNEWYERLCVEMGKVDKAWIEEQRQKGEKLLSDLQGCKSATVALSKFATCCSEYPHVATMTNVVDAVEKIVIDECNDIYDETELYLDCKIDLRDPKQMEKRRKDMNSTFGKLRTIVGGVDSVKNYVKGTNMLKFADVCHSRGGIDNKKVEETFKQDYKITRLDVKIDDKQKVEFEMSTLTFEEGGEWGEYVPSYSRGTCSVYEKKDKGGWKTIWPKEESDGLASVSGSPWKDAILYLKATKTNKILKNKTEEVRWLLQKGEKIDYTAKDVYGKYLEKTFTLSGFEVHVRIYVSAEGRDFFTEVGPSLGRTPAVNSSPTSGNADDGTVVPIPGLDFLGIPTDGVNMPL